jgi:hypothetical protein
MSGRVWSGRLAEGQVLTTPAVSSPAKASWLGKLLSRRAEPEVPMLSQEDTSLIEWIAKLKEGDPNPVATAHRKAAAARARREALAAQAEMSAGAPTEAEERTSR